MSKEFGNQIRKDLEWGIVLTNSTKYMVKIL